MTRQDAAMRLRARLREAVINAVAFDDVRPQTALATLMTVAASMVADVECDATREAYTEAVVTNFRTAVDYLRDVPGAIVELEAGMVTRQ